MNDPAPQDGRPEVPDPSADRFTAFPGEASSSSVAGAVDDESTFLFPGSPPTAAGLPYRCREPLIDLWHTLVGAVVLFVLPFLWFGRSEVSTYYGDGTEVNGIGWILVALMCLLLLTLMQAFWDIVRPGRWSSHAWWWEAGPAVAQALAPLPPPPSSAGGRIGLHLILGVAGGLHPWHLARAAAAAGRAEKARQDWADRCAQIRRRRASATPAAYASLLALEERYASRRGGRKPRSLETRAAMTLAARRALEAQGLGDSRSVLPDAHLRAPLRRVASVLVSAILTLAAGVTAFGLAQEVPPEEGLYAGPISPSPSTESDARVMVPPSAETTGRASSPVPIAKTPLTTAVTPVTKTLPGTVEPTPAAGSPADDVVLTEEAEPTCAALNSLKVSYTRATRQLEAGKEVWPRVTVRNGTKFDLTPHFSGGGRASNPSFPEFPLEMDWPDYDSTTVHAGTTKIFAVGEDTGLVLYVPPGGIIERFTLTVTVEDDDGRFGECPVVVRKGS